MKKNRQIYMLIVIYSLITITTFAREMTVCIANDHVGLKRIRGRNHVREDRAQHDQG